MSALLLLLASLGAEDSYTLDCSLLSMVEHIRVSDLSPRSDFVTGAIPALRVLPKTTVKIEAVPTGPERFYHFKINLEQPVWTTQQGRRILVVSLTKELRLTPDDMANVTRVWSSIVLDIDVDLPPVVDCLRRKGSQRQGLGWRIGARINSAVASAKAKAARLILTRERKILERLAAQASN